MKVTEEMIDAFGKAVWAYPWTDAGQTELSRSEVRDALQAILDLIEKEQRGFGVQSDRDDTVPELQCLLDDDCGWGAEVSGDPQLGWTTIADLARVAAEHAAEAHR